MRKRLSLLFGLLLMAAPAAAQDYKPVDVNFGFGWMFPSTDFKKSFDTGWNGAFGLTFNVSEHVGLQAEYIYSRMDGPDKTISVTATPVAAAATNGVIQSNHQMHVGSFNLVYRSHSHDRLVGGYVLGGGGIYHRKVQLTSPSVGFATVCDPFWYVCYPTAVSVDQILGDRSSNDPGVDFGGGVTFGSGVKFFVEARYHYVWGPSITPSASTLPAVAGTTANACSGGCSSNASYYPLTFGLRW
jgi:opacity protein-like surface antigen